LYGFAQELEAWLVEYFSSGVIYLVPKLRM